MDDLIPFPSLSTAEFVQGRSARRRPPLMVSILEWRSAHHQFLLDRKTWLNQQGFEPLSMPAWRASLHGDAAMMAKLDALLLKVATITTRMAIQA